MQSQSSTTKAFFVCFALGLGLAGLIMAFKLPNMWQLSLAVIVAIYAATVLMNSERTGDQIDSIYYLGFVFTIVALILSLIPLSWSQEKITAQTVLGAFSVALTTTLVGIVFKMLLGQHELDGDTGDAEEQLRRFSRSVGGISSSLQVVDEDIKRVSLDIKERHQKYIEGVIADTEGARKLLDEFVRTQQKEMAAEYKTYCEQLVATAQDLTEELNSKIAPYVKSLGEKLTSIEKSLTQVEQGVGNCVESIAAHTDSMASVQKEYVKSTEAAVYKQMENFSIFQKNLGQALDVKALTEASAALSTSTSGISEVLNEIRQIGPVIGSMTGHMESAGAGAQSLGSSLNSIAKASTTDLAESVVESMEKLSGIIEEQSRKLGASVDGTVNAMQRKLDDATGINEKMLQVVNDSTTSIVNSLHEKVVQKAPVGNVERAVNE